MAPSIHARNLKAALKNSEQDRKAIESNLNNVLSVVHHIYGVLTI
jgi:hypothetical protein